MNFDFAFFASLIIFFIVYGLIISRNIRGVNIPIWASMSIGACAVLVLQIIKLDDAFSAINFDVLFFLAGMFILVSGLESSGMLNYVTNKILSFAKTPRQILFFILFVLGLMSGFLINDTIALVATPIVICLARAMKMRSSVLLISLAFGITIGSMMTPMGNPQNLLVSIHSGINVPLLTFVWYLFLPTMTCLAVTYFILNWYYKKEFVGVSMTSITASKEFILDNPLAKQSSVLVIITVIGFFVIGFVQLFGITTAINFSHIAIFGGTALLLISKKKRQIIHGINWKILVFFVAMFVFMQGLWNAGIIGFFQSLIALDPSQSTSILNIVGTSIISSQIVSNVPFVSIYIPIMQNYGFTSTDTIAWIALAAASTIAGNLTILGAASNVIILETAERNYKETFSFKEFFKIGLIVTGANIALLLSFLFLYQL